MCVPNDGKSPLSDISVVRHYPDFIFCVAKTVNGCQLFAAAKNYGAISKGLSER